MVSDTTKILIVDDDETIRQSFRDYLEDHDYTVYTAANGRDGVEEVRQHRPDLALTDLRMPVLDGFGFMEQCKPTAPDLPIVVISGANRIKEAVEALRLGAWDYLIKPVTDFSTLLHTINSSLDKARLREENRRYRHHLEELVKVRTAELEEANQELLHINTRLRKVVETTKTLSVCSDISKFGATMLAEFADHMTAAGGSIYLAEKDGLRRLRTLSDEPRPEFIPFPLRKGSPFKRAMDSGAPILIKNIDKEKTLSSSGGRHYRDSSALIFPLPNEEGRVIGLLALHNKTPPPFAEQDREVGEILSSYSSESLRAVKATETLQESEARFRDLAEMLPEAVFETDRDLKIPYANRRAYQLFGYCPETPLDTKIGLDFFHPDERKKAERNFEKRLSGHLNGPVEYTAQKKDGTTFPMLFNIQPIYRDDYIIGYRGTVIDITGQKADQEELRRSLAEKDILLGEVHHRVKNNMQVIIALLNLQQDQCDPSMAPILDDIAGRVRIFADIHNSLYHQDTVSQIDFTRHLTDNFSNLVTANAVSPGKFHIVTDIPAPLFNLDVAVPCGLLLNELMTNSFKHAFDDHGEIKITMNRTPDGKIREIIYSDNGKPMTGDREGFGSMLITGMSAQLGLEFHISPQGPAKYRFERHTSAAPPEKRSGNILYVEDEVAIAMDRIAKLREAGYSVDENIILSGENAVKYIHDLEVKPSLVLMDVRLAGTMDGLDAAASVRRETPDLPLIFISGYDDQGYRQRMEAFDRSCILSKTCSYDELLEAVDAMHRPAPGEEQDNT